MIFIDRSGGIYSRGVRGRWQSWNASGDAVHLSLYLHESGRVQACSVTRCRTRRQSDEVLTFAGLYQQKSIQGLSIVMVLFLIVVDRHSSSWPSFGPTSTAFYSFGSDASLVVVVGHYCRAEQRDFSFLLFPDHPADVFQRAHGFHSAPLFRVSLCAASLFTLIITVVTGLFPQPAFSAWVPKCEWAPWLTFRSENTHPV